MFAAVAFALVWGFSVLGFVLLMDSKYTPSPLNTGTLVQRATQGHMPVPARVHARWGNHSGCWWETLQVQ